jgi:ribonuclease BN (tRNA processing enzyme)
MTTYGGLMKLQIIGSGTMYPQTDRFSSSYLITIKNEKILLDCGAGTLLKMFENRISYEKINHIFISHTHTDHVADLFPILHAIFVKGIFNHNKTRTTPLYIYGAKGFKKMFDQFKYYLWPDETPQFEINIVESNFQKIHINNITLEIFPVTHAKDKLKLQPRGIVIDDCRSTFVYTGDTDLSSARSVIQKSQKADALLIDCAKPINWGTGSHLEPREVGIIANEANVRKVILTHLTGKNENIDITDEIAKYYKGKVIIVKDGMKLSI